MNKTLDVYRDWLGIADAQRPLSFYQLLRLPKFEDDAAKVRSHYRKMNAHVRKYAAGDFAKQSQDLLNELARAMLCLTDTRRKEEYDETLGREKKSDRRRYTFDQLLVGRKVIDAEQLAKARKLADAINLELRDAVMQQKLATPDVVMQIYAESVGLPYVDLTDIGVDESLVPQVPALLARQNSCAPVMVDDGQLLMASPNPLKPDVEEELRLRVGMPVRTVLCTPAGINDAIARFFPKEAAAAELAAGGARPAGAAAPTKAATSRAAKADDDDEKPAKPAKPARSSAEAGRQGALVAIMAGNFTFVACAILINAMGSFFGIKGLLAYGIGLVLGGIVATIAWFVQR